MTKLADEQQRIRALTDLDATLLVEAAAGTGKTSLLAGRVVCLLAHGVPPREIAAITFTEFAAGELRERIGRYLDEMISGAVPAELQIVFGQSPAQEQRVTLEGARKRLDELTCSTIHGFCHALLRTYAIEAAIDPGAEVLDGPKTDLAFRTIFERWLRDRLDHKEASDPIAQTAERDPIRAEELLRDFAEFRRRHRTARPLPAKIKCGDDVPFGENVAEFRRWFNSVGGPPAAEQDITDLEQLAQHFQGKFDPVPEFRGLWDLAHPPRLAIMRGKTLDLLSYRRVGVWKGARGNVDGSRLAEEAGRYYDACAAAFRYLVGKIATAIISAFSAETDELMVRFETFKRNAAVLDFDDLLYLTRDVLRNDGHVRDAAGKRFARVLVDEFQDTDPTQAEIVFLLTGKGEPARHWHEQALSPGRLFMVGDPKQAIYRFRGADIATYRLAREAIERQFPGNVLRVASNFRSCDDILQHINRCFEMPLQGQETGYVALEATRQKAEHGLPCVAKVKVDVVPESRVDDIRDAEATVVTETCARLIGNVKVRRADRETHLVTAGDIALLAPTGTALWRYERALEEAGLPFSSQAGKNFFRRQEVQDLVALVRALADPRDTIALGALLRGPLVGLTEQELLDLAESLALRSDGAAPLPPLSLHTDPASIAHPLVRATLAILRNLRLGIRNIAPALLLADAIERLNVRAILVSRSPDQASRALANVDALLEIARAYGVRGFRQFARDLDDRWSHRSSYDEGVVDADEHAIKIVTIHSSKGLEWPVVIPINTASGARPLEQFVHRRGDDTLHWVLGDVVPPDLADAISAETQQAAEERLRLLYVACSRAMDLLVLPEFSWSNQQSWARALDFKLDQLPELNIAHFTKKEFQKPTEAPNTQCRTQFEGEQAEIERAGRIRWIRPSDGDPDVVSFEAPSVAAWEQPAEPVLVQGGAIRGIMLHKIMEEFVTGELKADANAVSERSRRLLQELSGLAAMPDLDLTELAETALRTWSLPELADHRQDMIAEVPVYGRLVGEGERLVAGRADAVCYRNGKPHTVFDWKSDVACDAAARAGYASQIRQYARVLGAERGAVVYMSLGQIQWITAEHLDQYFRTAEEVARDEAPITLAPTQDLKHQRHEKHQDRREVAKSKPSSPDKSVPEQEAQPDPLPYFVREVGVAPLKNDPPRVAKRRRAKNKKK
jgi:CRISPR-associated exonuclease Cas4